MGELVWEDVGTQQLPKKKKKVADRSELGVRSAKLDDTFSSMSCSHQRRPQCSLGKTVSSGD